MLVASVLRTAMGITTKSGLALAVVDLFRFVWIFSHSIGSLRG